MKSARRDGKRMHVSVLCMVLALALVAVACGSSRKDTTKPTDNSSGNTGGGVDTSNCPAGGDTTGISGNTITIGTSLPQSGTYAAFTAILQGENAYFKYVNDQGGVSVAGTKYKIKLVAKDDAYDAARTIANVNSLIDDTKVFSLFNVVGTKNNLGVRDTVNTDCVPNVLIASGAVQWGNPQYPWMIGSELVPYPLEVQTFVDYLKQHKPDATIAVLEQDDDFGQSYVDTLNELVKGTNLKVVQTQKYNPETSDVQAQVTSLAGTHADAFLLAAALLACPNGIKAAAAAGWKPITYMSGTCVSKVLFSLAGPGANNVLSVTPLLDPADPTNASNAAMQLYKAQVKKYASSADTDDGIVAYGWTTAALFVKALELSPKLDRGSLIERDARVARREGHRSPTSGLDVDDVGVRRVHRRDVPDDPVRRQGATHQGGRRPHRRQRQDGLPVAAELVELLARYALRESLGVGHDVEAFARPQPIAVAPVELVAGIEAVEIHDDGSSRAEGAGAEAHEVDRAEAGVGDEKHEVGAAGIDQRARVAVVGERGAHPARALDERHSSRRDVELVHQVGDRERREREGLGGHRGCHRRGIAAVRRAHDVDGLAGRGRELGGVGGRVARRERLYGFARVHRDAASPEPGRERDPDVGLAHGGTGAGDDDQRHVARPG